MRRTNVEQANFVVLRSADIPSLLVESGYITNPSDARTWIPEDGASVSPLPS